MSRPNKWILFGLALGIVLVLGLTIFARSATAGVRAPNPKEAEKILITAYSYELRSTPGLDPQMVDKILKERRQARPQAVASAVRPCALFGHSNDRCDYSPEGPIRLRWDAPASAVAGIWPRLNRWLLEQALNEAVDAVSSAKGPVSNTVRSKNAELQFVCKPPDKIPDAEFPCSAPVLAGKYAFVRWVNDCGALCGDGKLLALRKTGSEWTVVGSAVLWMK